MRGLGLRAGFWSENPPIEPGVVLALVLAVLLCVPVSRRLGTGRVMAWLLLAAFGVILAITMTPSREALDFGVQGTVSCDLSRIGPAPFAVYRRLDDPALNVLMFIPLGVLIGCLERRQHRHALALAAMLLPFAIETIQAFAVPLDRACQGGDVSDNLTGLFIGLAAGWVAGMLWRSGRAEA